MAKVAIFLALIFSPSQNCNLIHSYVYSVVDAAIKVEECIRSGGQAALYGELLMGDLHFLLGNYSEAEKRYRRVWEQKRFKNMKCTAGEKLIVFYLFVSDKEKVKEIKTKLKRECHI